MWVLHALSERLPVELPIRIAWKPIHDKSRSWHHLKRKAFLESVAEVIHISLKVRQEGNDAGESGFCFRPSDGCDLHRACLLPQDRLDLFELDSHPAHL